MSDIIALFIFVLILVGTPGPANMVVMAAGLTYGFKRSIPFIIGVTAGKLFLNIALGTGLYDLIIRYPILLDILKYVSATYMLWLSYRIAKTPITPHGTPHNTALTKPPNAWEGLIVHPLNPKAYAMLIIAWTDYGPLYHDPIIRLIIIGGCFLIVQAVVHSVWCIAGEKLLRIISNDDTKRKTQIALAVITALVVLYVVFK